MRLEVESQGYLDAMLSGHVRALDEQLPAATIRLTADGFKAVPDLPETLRVRELELTASGNMGDGYRLLSTGRLPGEVAPCAWRSKRGRKSERRADLRCSNWMPANSAGCA